MVPDSRNEPSDLASSARSVGPTGEEPVIGVLEQVWSSIAELGDGLPPEAWDLPTDCPGWTVRDQLSHMIGTERALLGERPPALQGPVPQHVRNAIGEANEAWVAARRDLPGPTVLEEFRDVTARRLRQLRSFDGARFDEVGPSPVGPVPYREFMDVRAFDCWVHEQDVRRAVGRPGDRYGGGEQRAVERVTALLGFVVAKRAGAPDGATVQWELTGPLGRTLAVAVRDGRGALTDPVAAPDVRITLDTDWFVRLGCGRVAGDEALASGAVACDGDTELGARVLGSMMGVMV